MRGKKNFDSMDSFTKEKNGGKWLSLDCRKGSGEKIEKRKRKGGGEGEGGDKGTKKTFPTQDSIHLPLRGICTSIRLKP